MNIYRKNVFTILLFTVFLMTGCSLPKSNTVPDKSDGTRKLVFSGTLHVTGRSYAFLVSGAWSRGVLHFKGKKYRIKTKSIGLGYSLGVKNINIKGTVYNLKSIKDINGKYAGIKAGATLYKGINVSNLTNSDDVVLGLTTKSKGAAIDFGAGLSSFVVKLMSTRPIK